jgi:hypothetical protein
MKSNAQLRREDSDDDMPAAMPVAFLDMASSSHTVPPSKLEGNISQIIEALAAIQGGMTTIQQTHLDLQECLQAHHLDNSDDEAVAPRAARRTPRTTPMAEDV